MTIELNMDSGTEFLLSRALETNNKPIVEYLLLKTRTTTNNGLIKRIVNTCKIDWFCQASFHFLMAGSPDLRHADENGQTLLHFAVEQAHFNLTKCLIDDYELYATDKNAKHMNWNAFFYCVLKNSEKSDVRKDIYTHMIKKNPKKK